MDSASAEIVDFLAALEAKDEQLRTLLPKLWALGFQAYLKRQIGATPCRRANNARECLLIVYWDFTITTKTGKEYSLNLAVLWDKTAWIIQVDAWVEADQGGMDLLQGFPERRATNVTEVLEYLDSAIDDLFSCQALLESSVRDT